MVSLCECECDGMEGCTSYVRACGDGCFLDWMDTFMYKYNTLDGQLSFSYI